MHLDAALDGLAENPALPAALIRRLVSQRRGMGQVARRPDLTAEMIDEIIASEYHWLLHSLALNPCLPGAVRWRLAGHDDPSIRVALIVASRDGTPADLPARQAAHPDGRAEHDVAESGHAPADLFARLITDPDRQVRDQLAQNDHVPADLRARLADDPDPHVRATLARWWNDAPEAVRRKLLTDSAAEVRAAACATYYARSPHPIPPADLVGRLLADPVTRAGAVAHLDLDAETARRLAEDPDDEVRRQLAAHPRLPADVRDQLSEDAAARVRVVVFARPDIPEPVRARIHAEILDAGKPLADVPADLDDQALLRAVEDSMAVTELRSLHLPWVTADPLPHVSSPYVCFRMSAAHATALPAPVIARLLDDPESIVRTAMARHAPHAVDAAAAERIDRDFRPEKWTAWRPADDFTFPRQTLRRFATDPDRRMRILALRDPDLPADLAELLATDPDDAVRHAVAGHPQLRLPVLTALLADRSEHVARAAASSPKLPLADMERLLTLAEI